VRVRWERDNDNENRLFGTGTPAEPGPPPSSDPDPSVEPHSSADLSYPVPAQATGVSAYGVWRDLPASDATTTSYTVTGLRNGTVYSFRIRAVNPAGNGDPSSEVTVTPVSKDAARADKGRTALLVKATTPTAQQPVPLLAAPCPPT